MSKLSDFILNQVSQKKITAEEAMQLFNELQKPPSLASQEFAVIGMACRFPQAENLQQFWDNMLQKKDAVDNFPINRINDVKYVNKQIYEQFKNLKCRIGTYLNRIDLFDHTFFGLTPAETRVMDPAQRLFLETAVEALENAGLTEADLQGSKTGVYVGYSINDDNYIDILSKDDPNIALGNQPSVLAYRLSYLFDLRGPTMIIDTACSSSLVAVHQACQAIAAGDCDQAIIGGVNIRLFPAIREIHNLGIEAFDGRCRTFDKKASGTNIGDGIAAVIIKRKDLAEKEGDFIYAIVKGSAVNSDGNSNGITAPNPEAQTAVITEAWKKAGIDPENLNFIETHGTGTKLGDPIEVLGLTNAFKQYTQKKKFCALGAVKTNIGHLEAASGLAGLIKAILCLKYRQMPPNIHYNDPNPFIDFENAPVFVNADLQVWTESNSKKLLGGVSSFGISGTNCHIVVEEYPFTFSAQNNSPGIIFVSAKNEESLKGILTKYIEYLAHCPFTFDEICYSSAATRNHYSHRLALIASSKEQAQKKIISYLQSQQLRAQMDSDIFYVDLQQSKVSNSLPILESHFQEILQSYLQGQAINKKTVANNKSVRKVPLPTYAFLPKRHWPKLEIEANGEEQRLHSLCYGMKWVEEEYLIGDNAAPYGKFLFFVDYVQSHEDFFTLSVNKGVEGIKVYPGREFKKINEYAYIINPSEINHYEWLLNATTLTGAIKGVIHMWDCVSLSNSMDNFESISTSQIRGAFCAYHLIRAFQARYSDPSLRFATLTAYAHQVVEKDKSIDPSRMPALGVNKVISQEFPRTSSISFDLDIDLYDNFLGKQLFAEIFDSKIFKDAVVAYRGHKRFVQIIDRLNIAQLKGRQTTIRENGLYVIAGGAGYLGMQTALLLAQKAHVKIVLLSRRSSSALTTKHHRQFDEIKKLGSEILLIQTDITNPIACSTAIDAVKQRYGYIHGVFVANKNISHQRLDEVPFDFFSHNILSKLRGVWLLNHLTSDQQLDFMAAFSSISSLTGGPTGADCCASNLFLDSYGDYRNSLGKTTIIMNYTLIEADDGSLLSDRLSMIPPLTKGEFVDTLNLFLTKELNFAVMADFDSHVMGLVLPFMKLRFSDRLLPEFQSPPIPMSQGAATVPKMIEIHEEHIDFNDLLTMMKKIWMDVLGYTELDERANFFEIGGDSISAVKLTHLIKIQLQAELQVSDLYSYPVLHDLTLHVHQKLYGATPNQSIKNILAMIDSDAVDLESAVNLLK